MQLITDSRLRTFRTCRRLHHFRYELLRRAIQVSRALAFGTLWHIGQEAWWRWWMPAEAGGQNEPTPLDAAVRAIAERLVEGRKADAEISLWDVAAVDALLVGYDARWRDDVADNWEVLAVEAPFITELVHPDTGAVSQSYRLAGKMDGVLRRRSDGAECVLEHKTTSSDVSRGSAYWPRLRMDSQISTYIHGARAIGYDPRFVLYDVVSKPSIEPLKATPEEKRKYVKGTGALYARQRDRDETPGEYRQRILDDISADPDAYYARAEIVRTAADLREAAWDTWQTSKSLHDTRLSGSHARNPDACWNYHRACDFWEVCTGSASIDDDTLFRTAKAAHEELATEEAAREAVLVASGEG